MRLPTADLIWESKIEASAAKGPPSRPEIRLRRVTAGLPLAFAEIS
jgi:hypothetical protein